MEWRGRQLSFDCLWTTKVIMSEEETTSSHGCGYSVADFSRPASVCLCGSLAQGAFILRRDGRHGPEI